VTSPDAEGGALYGPKGPGHLGGAPARQALYGRLTGPDDARRVWGLTEEMTGLALGAA
jgi:hypothetical protein